MIRVRTVLLLLSLPLIAGAQPRLEFEGGKTFTLGKVFRGDSAAHTVVLRNAGTTPLEITNVQASCGCTGTLLSARSLPPGQTGTIRVTFNSANFTGTVHKTVSVTSNDPASPVSLLEFTATIIEDIVLTPAYFWFRDATVGIHTRSVVTVRNDGEEPLLLRAPHASLEGLLVRVPPAPIAPGAIDSLVADFTPRTPLPFLSEWITVSTTNTRFPQLKVPVYGNVREFRFQ